MSRRNIPAIMIVLALLLGSLMIYATADLMGSMNPDPHSHRDSYDVVGTIDGDDVPGRATCTPVRENGAFYNYDFKTIMETEDGDREHSFFLIFDSDEKPFNYTHISDGPGNTRTYQTTDDGVLITITVSDNCLVESFTIVSGTMELRGALIQSEVFA